MCVAVSGKVISIEQRKALLDIRGIQKEVSIELLGDVLVGDYVLVHAGCAIQKIDKQEAQEMDLLFDQIQQVLGETND